MPKRKPEQDARYQKSRAAIEEASIQVLLRNPDASMSEIALSSGVGRATLYRHFESRERLIQALAKKCLDETDDLVAPLKQENLRGRAAIEATIDVLMPMADRFKFLLGLWDIAGSDRHVRTIYRRQLDELHTLVEQAKHDNDISDAISNDWIVATFDSLLTASWLMIKNGSLSQEDAASLFKRTFFDGLGD
ncbi:MAG: TetR/AcrR family transcriptional regulator [Pseudomonadota bacterium]